ncbi:MAG TPA: hypothetical protein VMY99_05200 [Nevskiaceae bacterium]|nr:hypothetical protein [Nevskiaceae bacterium]
MPPESPPPLSPDEAAALRAQAVARHGGGDYTGATDLRAQLIARTDPDNPHYGGDLSTYAASRERVEGAAYLDEAIAQTAEAEAILKGQVASDNQNARRIARRELPITTGYLGTFKIKRGAGRLRQPSHNESVDLLRDDAYPRSSAAHSITAGRRKIDESWRALERAAREAGRKPHQHTLNFMRRVSVAHSLDGNPGSGLSLAAIAALQAPLSESSWAINGTSPDMTPSQRRSAKIRALKGAVGAGAVALCMLAPGEAMNKRGYAWAERLL